MHKEEIVNLKFRDRRKDPTKYSGTPTISCDPRVAWVLACLPCAFFGGPRVFLSKRSTREENGELIEDFTLQFRQNTHYTILFMVFRCSTLSSSMLLVMASSKLSHRKKLACYYPKFKKHKPTWLALVNL